MDSSGLPPPRVNDRNGEIAENVSSQATLNSSAAEVAGVEAVRAIKDTFSLTGDSASQPDRESFLHSIPDEFKGHAFSILDGKDVDVAGEEFPKWNEFACEAHLWRALCLQRWRALETDEGLWRLIDKNVSRDDALNTWHKIYRTLTTGTKWTFRLEKSNTSAGLNTILCNVIARQICGQPLDPSRLPETVIVKRRFNHLQLQTFVLPNAPLLYFEPEKEGDRLGFNDFIDFLANRSRAGLATEDGRRYIFIPPCEYTRNHVGYSGISMLGVIQNVYPPLAP